MKSTTFTPVSRSSGFVLRSVKSGDGLCIGHSSSHFSSHVSSIVSPSTLNI